MGASFSSAADAVARRGQQASIVLGVDADFFFFFPLFPGKKKAPPPRGRCAKATVGLLAVLLIETIEPGLEWTPL